MAERFPGYTCSGCDGPLSDTILRCLSCDHYIICQECLCNNVHPSGYHELFQVNQRGSQSIVVCEGCPDKKPLAGTPYYKCVECISYHLCSTCYDKGLHTVFHYFESIDIPDNESNLPIDFSQLTLGEGPGGEQERRSRDKRSRRLGRQTSRQDADDLRFVIIGETGTGKSATANSILSDRNAFVSMVDSKSVTTNCKAQTRHVHDYNITVVDTPGLFDTRKPNTETVMEIVRCVLMVAPGPHAIIFTLNIGRMTKQVNDSVKILLNYFGEEAKQYIIIVFTHKDNLSGKNSRRRRDIHEFVREIDENDVSKLLQDCGMRYVAFDNEVDEKSEANKSQVQELLTMVKTMVEKNGGSYYTNTMMEEAEARMKEREGIIRKRIEADFKAREERLRQMYSKELKEKMLEELKKEFEARNPRVEANDEIGSSSGWGKMCKKVLSYLPTAANIGVGVLQVLKLLGRI